MYNVAENQQILYIFQRIKAPVCCIKNIHLICFDIFVYAGMISNAFDLVPGIPMRQFTGVVGLSILDFIIGGLAVSACGINLISAQFIRCCVELDDKFIDIVHRAQIKRRPINLICVCGIGIQHCLWSIPAGGLISIQQLVAAVAVALLAANLNAGVFRIIYSTIQRSRMLF